MKFSRRLLRNLLTITALLLVAAAAGCAYAFRDRHPGYKLTVNIPSGATNAGLRVGFARVKINPDLSDPKKKVWLAGFKQGRAATSIHDDLWALACVIDDGKTRLGIAALDTIGFFHDDVVRVRQRLQADSKLDYAIVCSTHNHNGPDLVGLWGPNYLRTGVNADYREGVVEAAAKVLNEAAHNLHPAAVTFRELPAAPEGLVADLRKPEVFDPNIRVMHFTNPTNGATLGTIVGWADHPETVWSRNTEVTADYPGYLRDTLENGVKHRDAVLEAGIGGTHLYINGAVGGLMSTPPEVTVRDPYLEQDFKEPTHEKPRALGRQIASRVLKALESTNNVPVTDAALAIRARTLEIPLRNKLYILASLFRLLDRGYVRWKVIRTEIALVTFGDASIVCIPGEIYPEIVNGGIEKAPGGDYKIQPIEVPALRELMPGKIKFVFGLANDEIGYIIPKSEWDKKRPYLYGAKKKPYGEINSVGPETGPLLHAAFRDLIGPQK